MKYKENSAGKLARLFIKHPLTLTLGILILIIGYVSLTLSPREANPQIIMAGGQVMVQYPGVSAGEIDKVIVQPLSKRLREIEGIDNIYGVAKDNVGFINVQFVLGEDVDKANLRLYNSVMRNIDALPKDIMVPIVRNIDIDTDVSIMGISFYSKNNKVNNSILYKEVFDIQNKINRIKNVAITSLKGEKKKQYNIEVNLNKLSGYHISLGQIANILKEASMTLPSITGRTLNGDIRILEIEKSFFNEKDLGNLPISNYNGSVVYLKDVAKVSNGYTIQSKKEALINFRDENNKLVSKNQITITVSKVKGSNVVNINKNIEELLSELKPSLDEQGIGFIITKDDGYTANHSVNELVEHILVSIAIISIILVIMLGIKEAVIITLTVPMIISITLFAGYMLGFSINKISLFALLLSLGLLVDAAIIVIENIHRHFHSAESKDKAVADISTIATNEIGNPTNLATIAIIMTFLTMFLVGGTIGQYIRPIAVFAPIAMLASLIIAYIFTPYLVNKIMTKEN